MAMLQVECLKKIYTTRFGGNQVQALSDVSFSVETGEYVAIMGESGSGKTTLLNILAALDQPTSGKVFLDGKDLEEIKEVVAMTRLGQMLYDDGLKAGKSEGRIEGSDRMASLTKKLLEADRMADLQLALDDPGYREKLMDEYGIK